MTSPTAQHPESPELQIYVVGGAVRDELLGMAVYDRDYVVVGATPKHMVELGYLPVGKDFPVFLHPQSKEEYALARTERKTAPGYGGFVFHTDVDVTLEQDLKRRDLTINAIARPIDGGALIDPCGGVADIAARIFRHIGPAFVEDPVRLLRLARFAARFPEFEIADETRRLLRAMVNNGEVDALVPERVWAEVSRGLMAEQPARMLTVLKQVGALARIAPGAPAGERALGLLDQSALSAAPLAQRFAVWLVAGGLGAARIKALCNDLRAPADVRDHAMLLALLEESFVESPHLNAKRVLFLLERLDALRREARFMQVIEALAILHPDDLSASELRARLAQGLVLIRSVDAGQVARLARGGDVAAAVYEARLDALHNAFGR